MTTTSFVNGSTLSDGNGWANDVDTFVYSRLTSVSGTNTVVGTGPASMTAYATGQRFSFIQGTTNTGAATLNITPSGSSALGAKAIQLNGSALTGSEMITSMPVEVMYDGTQFQIMSSASVAMIRTGTWTPVLNSWTVVGGTTLSGTYVKIGRLVYWACSLDSATTLASTAGTSTVTGINAVFAVSGEAQSVWSNGATGIALGTGHNNSGGIFPPSIGATGDLITASGVYIATT